MQALQLVPTAPFSQTHWERGGKKSYVQTIRRKGLEAAVEIRCEATAPEGERGGRGYGRMERSLSKQLHSALLERGCTPVPGVVAL